MFRQGVTLELITTQRDGSGDTTAHFALFEASKSAWYNLCLTEDGEPTDAVTLGISPNRDTNVDVGMVEWSINIEPCHVPGILDLEWYVDTGSGPELDHVESYTLEAGVLSTGPLTVGLYDGSDDPGPPEDPPWADVRFRFWPSYLTAEHP